MADEMLFGFCYMPQVLRVEDFGPYWVLDRWTRERTLSDLKIMRAIGASCVRIHITPPVPGATAYDRLQDRRSVPITGEKYLQMCDLMVHTANDLGMKVHFDIGSSFSEVSEASLDGWITRYRGLVESYQFGNENYSVFADEMASGETYSMDRFRRLLAHARKLDPEATFTADLFTDQLLYLRDHYPDVYEGLGVLNTHPYFSDDDRGWTDEWVEAIVAVHGNGIPWPFDRLPPGAEHVFLHEFSGIAELERDVWITEIVAHADGVWSSLVPEEQKAAGWRKLVQGLARCQRVKRVYYCWLTDKMHALEAGSTQIGAIRYDGAPRPLTEAFREMAETYAAADSLIRRLAVQIEPLDVIAGASAATMTCRLENRGSKPIAGQARWELPRGVSGDSSPFVFSLGAGESLVRGIPLQIGALPETHNHVFLRLEAQGSVHYGWGILRSPRPLTVEKADTGIPSVRHVPDLASVQAFLSRYGDACAVVVGPGTGHWDTELGYRLKIVIESLRGRDVPIVTAQRLAEVWDRPLVIVGRPPLNYAAFITELGLPEGLRAEDLDPGHGFVQVVERPLGEPLGSWACGLREKLIGFHRCPAGLYIAGGDDEGTKRAAYDLIRRLWHPEAERAVCAWWV
ncbi:MAG: hypothetical protein ACUVX9_15405 [Anaerolineae bacterium]